MAHSCIFDWSTCSKSQYKFRCYSCGEQVQRGDNITMTHSYRDGMTLRSGMRTGTTRWVHIGCTPCRWLSWRNGTFDPFLNGVWTDWDAKVQSEFDAQISSYDGHCYRSEFLEDKGYPAKKYMSTRIKRGVVKFQALWRGYLYKRALPIAIQQARREAALRAWFEPGTFNPGCGQMYRSVAERDKRVPNQPDNRFDIGDIVECPFDVSTRRESFHRGIIVFGQYFVAGEDGAVRQNGWRYLVKFKDGETLLYSEETLIRRTLQVKEIKETMSSSGVDWKMEVLPHCTYTNRFRVQAPRWQRKLLVKQGKIEDVGSDFYLYRLVASGQLKSYTDDY